jgi:hypothetical protein
VAKNLQRVPERIESVLPPHRGAAFGVGQGDHRNGIQTGADHLRYAQAREAYVGLTTVKPLALRECHDLADPNW